VQTIEELKQAVERGETVHWKNEAYALRKYGSGDWYVVCINGYVSPLNGHKPEDFFIAGASTKVALGS